MSTIKSPPVASVSFHKLAIAFLWLVLVISSVILVPSLTQKAAAYGANDEAGCVALGGSWEAPNASNYGRGGCSGKGPCEATGGIWTAQGRICTTVGANYVSDSMDNRVKAFNYYSALAVNQCNFGGSITGEDIGNYVWLLGSNPHLAQGSRGSLDCNQRDGKDGKWLREAMQLFNIPGSTAGEKLCALGMTQTSVSNESLRASCGADAKIGSDKFEWKGVDSPRSSVLSTIRKWYFSSQEPTFTDAMTYHVAVQDFFNAQLCAASTTPAANYSNNTSTSKSFSVFVVDGGSVKPKEYTVTGDNQYKAGELYNITALDGSRYVVANVPCADYPANANSGGNLPTLGSILGDRKYADAYLNYITNNQNDTTTIGAPEQAVPGADNADATTCAIDGIGWIVCPVVNFLSSVADGAFTFLANNFLQTDVSLVETGGPVHLAWQQMRNLANIAFVIAFLIIIYSQITSAGISNYGVKKMLPRLIVAAILVNMSFFICQIAVDLSNILGFSLRNFLANLVPTYAGIDTGNQATGGGFAGVAGGILAGAAIGGLIYVYLSALIPIVLAAIVALLMILFILVARQALIVALIIVAPLAFVAFLLPNTESFYKKWQKSFIALLLVFPMIALVFGGSSLAASVLSGVFNPPAGQGDTSNWWGQLIGAAIAILPLFVVPSLLKKSLDGFGNIGARLNGLGGKLGGALGKRGGTAFGNSALGRGQTLRKQARQKYRDQQFGRKVAAGGMASRLSRGVGITKAQKAANEQIGRIADSAADKAVEEDIAAASIGIQNLTGDAISDMANGGHFVKQADGTKKWTQASRQYSDAERTAAIRHTMKTGSFDEKRTVLENIHTAGSDKSRQSARDGYYASGLNNYFGSGLGDSILTGNGGAAIDTTAAMQENFGSITPQTIAGSNKASMQYLRRAYQGATAEKRAIIEAAFSNIEATPELRAQVAGDAKQEYDSILAMMTAPATQGAPTPSGDPTVLNVRDNQPPAGPTAPPSAGSPQ